MNHNINKMLSTTQRKMLEDWCFQTQDIQHRLVDLKKEVNTALRSEIDQAVDSYEKNNWKQKLQKIQSAIYDLDEAANSLSYLFDNDEG
jgi:hypothetical protein